MIKVSVMYAGSPNDRFDHVYYEHVHMRLVQSRLGSGIRYYTVDRGIGGGPPGSDAPYVAMCHLFCESVEAFQAALAPHGDELNQDIINFTDLSALYQISEVVVSAPYIS